VEECNIVVLCGRVSSEPRSRELPSGSTLVQVEVTTRTEAATATVPVVWFDPSAEVVAGTDVVVVGQVRRRFFRAGGVTQSRTEVVAARIVPATRRRQVQREVARAMSSLTAE
jgi:single-strand DNA-binding protein